MCDEYIAASDRLTEEESCDPNDGKSNWIIPLELKLTLHIMMYVYYMHSS